MEVRMIGSMMLNNIINNMGDVIWGEAEWLFFQQNYLANMTLLRSITDFRGIRKTLNVLGSLKHQNRIAFY